MSIQYSPHQYGVEIIAELEAGGGYDFDTVLVVRSLCCNKMYAAHDSGCSCPTPFEDVKYPTDYVEVTSLDDLLPLMAQQSDYSGLPLTEKLDFLTKVRIALRGV